MEIPNYLLSNEECGRDVCYGHCAEPVKQNPETGRWFITMSHPGFNSPANNCYGYSSKRAALRAMVNYGRR